MTVTEESASPTPSDPTEPPPRRSRRVRRLVLLAVTCALLALVVPVVVVQAVGSSKVHSIDDVPARSVAIVLGAGLQPDGTPSTFLRRRLDTARELYEQGTVEVILVSGDNRRVGYDEPTAMRDWLVAHGVPDDRIVRDFAGFDTHDTCVRANEVFGVEDAVVVTSDYHLRRALFSCSAAGIDVVGVGSSSTGVSRATGTAYRGRELIASSKAGWDALLGRAPVHGGTETSVQDALDAAREG